MAANREAHLAMIQDVVTRMGQNSILLKGWSILFVSALLTYASSDTDTIILFWAFIPVLLYWGFDGYYLWQERLYRDLYNYIREQDPYKLCYELSTDVVLGSDSSRTWSSTVFSLTPSLFHGVILFMLVVILLHRFDYFGLG